MPYKDDNRIEIPFPFLTERTVLYIGDENDLFRAEGSDTSRAGVFELFRSYGKKLVFLSDILKKLNPDMLQYIFPGQDSPIVGDDVYKRIFEAIGTGGQPGFIYRQLCGVYCHTVTATDNGQELEDIRDFVSFISIDMDVSSISSEESIIYCEESEEKASRQQIRRLVRERRKEEKRRIKDEKNHPSLLDMLFSENAEEREQILLDPRTQAILDAWEKIEREFGITIEALELLLGYKVELSKLNITTSSKLFLSDFENREVKMDDLTKALYFFYLRHPEGARLKELHEHEDEILHLYSGITGRDDTKKIQESVRNLLNPFGNALNVSMSRIKKAFKDVVGDRIARFYYVSGSYGEVRKVELDRDLVIWEH